MMGMFKESRSPYICAFDDAKGPSLLKFKSHH
jgi:hypothetical protein